VDSTRPAVAELRNDLLWTLGLVLGAAAVAVLAFHQQLQARWPWWAFCTVIMIVKDFFRYQQQTRPLRDEAEAALAEQKSDAILLEVRRTMASRLRG
jgi:hypothetical protein